jgi:hypothetical protein
MLSRRRSNTAAESVWRGIGAEVLGTKDLTAAVRGIIPAL